MSPRRWFWTLIALSLVWCFAGYRWDGDAEHPERGGRMRWVQNDMFGQVLGVALVPAEFVFSGIEGVASSAVERVTARGNDSESADSLREQLHNAQAQNARLVGLLDDAYGKLGALARLPSVGLSARDVVEAHVVAMQAGAGANSLHLDKGASDGVRAGMAVVAPLEQVTVLGRVVVVGQKECDVQLLSDPMAKTRADIVRNANTRVTAACIVEGDGSNMMRCRTVDVPRPGTETPLVPPERGDFVRLIDPSWPPNVQYMVIGQIDQVGTRENQPLRYELRITPLRAVSSLRSVMIVVKE
jgi:hypothetical protein